MIQQVILSTDTTRIPLDPSRHLQDIRERFPKAKIRFESSKGTKYLRTTILRIVHKGMRIGTLTLISKY